jgi:hypothetical protein
VRIINIYLLVAFSLIVTVASANAQIISGGFTPPPSLKHELMLILIGAVLGGFLGPLFQILDSWIGISPGARQQKANYQVQREIAAHLAVLVKQAMQNTELGKQGLTHFTGQKKRRPPK